MCGIAGIFHFDDRPASLPLIQNLTRSLSHRGPDDEGYYTDKNFGFGHRRLAIIDTSVKGRQPMMSKNGEWIVTFNGCIYNFKTLKHELSAKGHEFVSSSDTEVIVEGLAEYGQDFFEKLNGMFAIAAWNIKESRLILSRDRYGTKPLYYWQNGRTFLFASEIKAFFPHPEFEIKLNESVLNEYFTFQNVFRYQTLFDGVEMLPPANTIEINSKTRQISHNSWWDFDFTQPDMSMSIEDAGEETIRLLKQSVARQTVADVPVGTYLSGGIDSGAITSIATQHIERLPTFTGGFDMSSVTGEELNYDERRQAEQMSSYFNTQHYQQVINAKDLKWSIPKVVWHIEDLRLGMTYPHYYLSHLASKFVKVCLQGTAGDELYGGYPWRYYRVFHSLNKKEFFNNYYAYWQRLVNDEEKKKLFTNKVLNKIDINAPRQAFERVFTFSNTMTYTTPERHIENSLYFEIKTFLNGLLLVGDKLSMAHGLEERYPFLDNDLVAFAQKIPVKYKLGNLDDEIKRIDENAAGNKFVNYGTYNDGKSILRKALKNLLPPESLQRKKQGFSAPDESWYRGENADYIRNLLLNNKTVSTEYINRSYMEKTINEHLNKRINHRLRIWSFICFEWWCKIFLDNQTP